MGFRPSYIRLYESGELFERIKALNSMLSPCVLCPRRCGAQRNEGLTGVCNAGRLAEVSAAIPHFGEEAALTGRFGSGAIFLSWCNLKCRFCQNSRISSEGDGRKVSSEELSSMMLSLQREGCHNINFVSPTHQAAQIVEALPLAIEQGLDVPLVYNTGGYDSIETLRLLDGVFDIYMPDMKYGNDDIGKELSGVPDYFTRASVAIREMHRQVGDLKAGADGIAQRGLIVRHLVLPAGLSGAREVMRCLAGISENTYVNIMDQYRPLSRALEDERISRRVSEAEFEEALGIAREEGLRRLEGFC